MVGVPEQWQASQEVLRAAAEGVLAEEGLALIDGFGEAAFHDPKLDLQVRVGRGQEETIATVQLDFNQPENFDLTYQAADGSRQRVVMIHRGTVGAMGRVVAALLERYQGRLPFWLAPVQVVVLPVAEPQDEAARAAVDARRAAGLRAEIGPDGSLGARIRDARRRRASLVAVIGEREVADGVIQVTDGSDSSRRSLALEELVAEAGLPTRIASRSPGNGWLGAEASVHAVNGSWEVQARSSPDGHDLMVLFLRSSIL